MTDSVQIFPPGFRVVDTSGVPYSGATIEFYDAGTTTPKSVYADKDLSTSLGDTVTCDSAGYPTSDGTSKTAIYTGTASYKVVLKTSTGATIVSLDHQKGATQTSNLVASFGTIASATTTDLGSVDATVVEITGTTTITSFGTGPLLSRKVYFSGALTLTHNATSLILPGAGNITTAAGDTAEFVSDASGNWRCLNYQRAAIRVWDGGVPDVIIEDQRTSGTSAGTSTSGSFETRTLNTLVRNFNSIASLSSNAFTLPAGVYFMRFQSPAVAATAGTTTSKAKIRNTTDSTDAIIGTSTIMGSDNTFNTLAVSSGSGVVTISASKTFEIQHRVSQGLATVGQGQANTFSVVEVYARVEIWRIGA